MPPSGVTRPRTCTMLGIGTKPPARRASPCRNRAAWASSPRGTKPKIDESWSRSSREFIRIRVEVVALRHDSGMHLRRTLRRDQQPQAVLAPLCRDLDDAVAHGDTERGLGVGRAEVVRLVDDEQERATLGPARPQVVENGESDRELLLVAVVATEVEHGRGRAPRDDGGRALGAVGPGRRPLEHAEVLESLGERVASGSPSESRCPTMSGVSTASRSSMRPSRALYSARSTTGSSRSTAALARGVISLKSTCRGDCLVARAQHDDFPIPECRSRMPGQPPRSSRRDRTKSLLGSKTTIGSRVVSRMRSRSTPSAYVLPEPL